MISTFQRDRHFRKVSVKQNFNACARAKKSNAVATFRLHSVQCKMENGAKILYNVNFHCITSTCIPSTYILRNTVVVNFSHKFSSVNLQISKESFTHAQKLLLGVILIKTFLRKFSALQNLSKHSGL